jgi:hypothetical protein
MGNSSGPPLSQTPTAEFDVPKSMPHASVTGVALGRRLEGVATIDKVSFLTSLQFFLTLTLIQHIESRRAEQHERRASDDAFLPPTDVQRKLPTLRALEQARAIAMSAGDRH